MSEGPRITSRDQLSKGQVYKKHDNMIYLTELKDGHLYRIAVQGSCNKCVVRFDKKSGTLLKTSKSNQDRCRVDSTTKDFWNGSTRIVCHSIYDRHEYTEYLDCCEITGNPMVIGEL